MADGETVTVTLYYKDGTLSQTNLENVSLSHGSLTIAEKSLSRDGKTMTLVLTSSDDFVNDRNVVIKW